MSEDIQPGVPTLKPEQARNVANDMLKAGVPIEEVNSQLAAGGYQPIAETPVDQAERQLDRLKADSEWVRKLNAGDADANSEFSRLTARLAFGAKPEPAAPDASDYRFNMGRVGDDATAQKMQSEAARFSADLKLPPNVASAVVDLVLDNTFRAGTMSAEQAEAYGEQQLVELRSVLAKNGDPDAQIKAAQETLKRHSGRDINIAAIARTSGAQVANELLLHAAALAFRASR